jgi:uncharacterized protein (DUF983 family)
MEVKSNMKCPNCNQEIIDNKTFCTNCGKKLKDNNINGMAPNKLFMIVVVIMLFLGVGVIYIIANIGTKQELDNILKPKTTINSFYDSYLIKSVITTGDTPSELVNLKDDLIDFEMELTKESFKVGIYQILWAQISNPSIKEINTIQRYKDELNIIDNEVMTINIQGVNNKKGEVLSFDMISVGSKIYLYYLDTYFELKPSTLGYKSSKTYYKVNLLKENYASNINAILKEINDKVKTNIENEIYEVYTISYEEYEDNDVIHIVIREASGLINSEMVTKINTISFNKDTGVKYNLKAYVEHIGREYEDIISLYEANREIVYNGSVDGVTVKFETSPDLLYYVKDGSIYIACGADNWGTLFAQIKLKGE